MAIVAITVGGRRYEMACREGEQGRFEQLGRMVDAKASEAAAAMGGLTEPRQLLLAALLLADELSDARAADSGAAGAAYAPAITALAQRIELLAERLEKEAGQT